MSSNPNLPITWTELTTEENEIVKKHFPTPPLNDLIKYQPGNVVVPRTFLPLADRIYNFELREDDIWIVTYPKCGTTWTQEMLWMIVNDVDQEKGQLPLFTRTPFLEMGCITLGKTRDFSGLGIPENVKSMLEASLKDAISYTEDLQGRRVIKTHMPLEFLPPKILEKCKVVYVARNVKDCAVSYFHHNVHVQPHDFQGSFSDFVNVFEKELVFYGSYWHHVLGGWKKRDNKNLKFIWFEEMKADQKRVIEELCTFLDHPLSEDKVETLVEHLKFENIRKNPAINPPKPEGYKFDFIRKGVVGDWKNYFTEEKKTEWNAWIEKKTRGTGMAMTL